MDLLMPFMLRKMSELYRLFNIGSEPDIENIKTNLDICFILVESP